MSANAVPEVLWGPTGSVMALLTNALLTSCYHNYYANTFSLYILCLCQLRFTNYVSTNCYDNMLLSWNSWSDDSNLGRAT